MKVIDYYEFLQISPNAEEDTIHRVYRFLAARLHPDNPVSGDMEKFSTLMAAYGVLSDPVKRAAYDATRKTGARRATPLSKSVDFMDDVEGERNRRLAVLALLYSRRRTNPFAPQVALAEIEARMGFPREYLDFATWYLQKKGYITKADNSDFTLTVQGVDFVETQRVEIPALNRLLTVGAGEPVDGDGTAPEDGSEPSRKEENQTEHPAERRAVSRDRRVGLPDARENPVERRTGARNRRENRSASGKMSR